MGLLDEITVSIEIPTKAAVTKTATRLLKKHTTRRSKRKKKPRDAKWHRKVAAAKAEQRAIKKQLAEHYASFRRGISQ